MATIAPPGPQSQGARGRALEGDHLVAAYGLVHSSGNLSWRIDDERMLVTASKTWMAELTPEAVAAVRRAASV